MPVQVSYPGVYIQEVPSGVHTITGVATSIAAFIGRTSKGKMNKATRILSLADYVRAFGDPLPGSDLANSVRLFFANGGTDCYVIRIANGGLPAKLTLNSVDTTPSLNVTAKAEGRWGDSVRLIVDYNTQNPDETFNLRVVYEEGGTAIATESFPNLSMNPGSPRFAPTFVTQSSELISVEPDPTLIPKLAPANIGASFPGFSLGRRSLNTVGGTLADVDTLLGGFINAPIATRKSKFEISVNDSGFQPVDLNPYTLGNTQANIEAELTLRINTALAGLSPAPTVLATINNEPGGTIGRLLRITANNGDRINVRVRSASSNDISAALMLGVDQGGIELTRYSNFRPAPSATFLSHGVLTTPGDLTNLNNMSNFLQNNLTGLTIDGVAVGPFSLQTSGGGNPWFSAATVAGSPNDNNDGIREKLKIIAAAINSTAGLAYSAEVWGYHLAILARGGPFNKLPTINTTPVVAALLTPLTAGRNGRQYTLGAAGGGPFSTAGQGGN